MTTTPTTMIDLTATVRSWTIHGIWRVAPGGFAWIVAGSRVRVGKEVLFAPYNSLIGNHVTIGNYCSIDNNTMLANGVELGDRVNVQTNVILASESIIASGVLIKFGCIIGVGATVGKDVVIGSGSKITGKSVVGAGVELPRGTVHK